MKREHIERLHAVPQPFNVDAAMRNTLSQMLGAKDMQIAQLMAQCQAKDAELADLKAPQTTG